MKAIHSLRACCCAVVRYNAALLVLHLFLLVCFLFWKECNDEIDALAPRTSNQPYQLALHSESGPLHGLEAAFRSLDPHGSGTRVMRVPGLGQKRFALVKE